MSSDRTDSPSSSEGTRPLTKPGERRRIRAARPPLQRISGPAELLQAVPYLLGFHPEQSLVLVGLSDGQLVVTARVDLPARTDAPGTGDLTIAQTVRALADGGATELIAAIFDDRPHRTPDPELIHRDVVDMLRSEVRRRACRLLDAVLVRDGRWWSYLCESVGCCPSEGTVLPETTSSFAVAATVAGVVPMRDRASLASLLEPIVGRTDLAPLIAAAEHAEIDATLAGGRKRHDRAQVRTLFAAARSADEPGWRGVEDVTVARLGVALAATNVRDALWMGVDDGRLDGRELWRALGRGLPAPYRATPLFLFGWSSWRAGDGALAGIAAELAIASDPTYTAADLLLAALDRGVDPRRLPRLRLPRGA